MSDVKKIVEDFERMTFPEPPKDVSPDEKLQVAKDLVTCPNQHTIGHALDTIMLPCKHAYCIQCIIRSCK